MSSEFQPSAASAQGIGSTIIQQTYPDGSKGLAFSLEQVGARMVKGRLDPRVRSWAIRTLKEAGDPQGTVNRTQALLDGLRKAAIYVNDPVNSEYMQAAHETLCLDDKGFCFKGGDCFLDTEIVIRKTSIGGTERVAIKDVKIGDLVWGWNTWTVVEAVAAKGELSFSGMLLEGRSNPLYLTKDHHVFIRDGVTHRRITVKELRVGDELLTSDEIQSLSPFPEIIELQHDVKKAQAFDIQTSDHYVYLLDYDIVVSQCDDLSIALGSATMSVGIPTYVVAQAFNGDSLPSHVLIGVEDPQSGQRYRVDPSTKENVGYYSHFTKEWWIDPISTAPVSLSGTGKVDADFVGVGQQAFQQATAVTAVAYNATVAQVQAVTKSLADALISAESKRQLIDQVSIALRPDAPYDAEPTTPIQSIADFPIDGTWTASMAHVSDEVIATGHVVLAALNDALNGARTIYLGANGVDVYIEAKSSDNTFYQMVLEGATDGILGFMNPLGVIQGGITVLLGKLLTPAQITAAQQAQVAGQPPPGLSGDEKKGLGLPPAVIFAGLVTIAIVTVAAAIVIVKLCTTLNYYLDWCTQRRQIEAAIALLNSGKITVDQYNAMTKAVADQHVAAINAQTEQDKNDPWKDRLAQIGDIFMWTAIGGVAIAGLMAAGPFIAEAGAEFRARGAARRAAAPPEPAPEHEHPHLEPEHA
jgi:hypothetical protein